MSCELLIGKSCLFHHQANQIYRKKLHRNLHQLILAVLILVWHDFEKFNAIILIHSYTEILCLWNQYFHIQFICLHCKQSAMDSSILYGGEVFFFARMNQRINQINFFFFILIQYLFFRFFACIILGTKQIVHMWKQKN